MLAELSTSPTERLVNGLHSSQVTLLCRIAFDYVRKYTFDTVRAVRLSKNMGKVSTTCTCAFCAKTTQYSRKRSDCTALCSLPYKARYMLQGPEYEKGITHISCSVNGVSADAEKEAAFTCQTASLCLHGCGCTCWLNGKGTLCCMYLLGHTGMWLVGEPLLSV